MKALRLTEELISRRSPTPDDGGCQPILSARLSPLGFECETIVSGPDDFRVTNLWAKRAGSSGRTLVFAGHTDVVPTGPIEQWTSDPFSPTHRDGFLFGRGAAIGARPSTRSKGSSSSQNGASVPFGSTAL